MSSNVEFTRTFEAYRRRFFGVDRGGCHRTVLLVGPYVVKVPVVGYGLQWWVRGWLVNCNEAATWRCDQDEGLCPVLFSLLGLLIVMPRCEPMSMAEHAEVEAARAEFESRRGHECSAEPFAKSYGRLDGRVVAFDYGTVR